MAQRVTLDAMIPREDFAVAEEEFALDLFQNFPITNLLSDSAILKLLRKPDFQRETNHWSPEQVATLVASFLDNEVIPSLILWKSPTYIFVIDGGHRLSALRAWIEDDYGDGALSSAFYKGEISEDQKKIAKRTRQVIEQKVGRFTSLRGLIDAKVSIDPVAPRRANRLFTRALNLQWIQGNADVAETSFFKINSQGTPLDDTEEMLIKNRRKPIAIGARAILRSGTGHKYWSSFSEMHREQIEGTAGEFYELLFEPESNLPLKTLDVPFGGSVSPVEALSLLIDFLTISGSRQAETLTIDKHPIDETGEATIGFLRRSLEILNRITGNSAGSLGLHPAVYFYNERGKYNRFLFLGMTALLTERVRNNDDGFFKKFTRARSAVEAFLVDNKSLIALVQQNMSKAQRVPRMKKLFEYLIDTAATGGALVAEDAIAQLGLRGRILDINAFQSAPHFSDDAKSMMFVNAALSSALRCPICNGYLHPTKSVSYDHIVRRAEGGTGDVINGQMAHPFCNTGMKS
ncbi:GmrSD restriction endonuclease domain-containing protein [Variovorax sp. 350MFTsu5.1]|uniref:GmrSD restriction endonuclease domain-containing protein n=1 Tax=Variovorax sp. 350MFTsu5.1 TaxID=3158365 RepID=UPI003AAE55BB